MKSVNLHASDSIGVYDKLKQRGVKPSIGVVLSALKVCRSRNDVQTGKRIHEDVLQNGDYANIFVANILEDMYCRAGKLPEARQVFESMKHRDVVSWNSLILGYARAGQGDLALELFSRMQDEGFTQNQVTILAALKACESLSDSCLQKVRAIHSQALKISPKGLELFVASTIVNMYSKSGSMDEARQVFDTMKTQDTVSWTALIHGYALAGEPELALQFYTRMERLGNVKPDRITLLAALKACVALAEKEQGRFVNGKLVKVNTLERIRAIHLQATQSRVEQDVVVATALVDVYSKCKDMTEARRIFDCMREKDVVSWTSIMAGYAAQGGEEEEALALYKRMKEEGCCPDGVTYIAVLKACGSLAALETGRNVHSEILDAGIESQLVVANSLLDFYGRCGCMEEAKAVFERMERKDLVSWGSLITGYGSQGDARSVLEVYERMQEDSGERFQPDDVTFLSVLNACSHAGMVERGKACFKEMVERFGLQPGIQHYTCMIDMLGRGNRLNEGLKMLKAMPLEANEVTWTVLLSSALRWGNVCVGEEAFQALVKMAGVKASTCVVMWRIYTNAGMWEDAQRIQEMRKNVAKEVLGMGVSSWIDQHGNVHRFCYTPKKNVVLD